MTTTRYHAITSDRDLRTEVRTWADDITETETERLASLVLADARAAGIDYGDDWSAFLAEVDVVDYRRRVTDDRTTPNGPDTVLLVWGRGASTVDAIRDAESDANYVDAAVARGLGDACERDDETQGYVLLDDAWCVAVDPASVTTSDLDRDPAVRGYREVGTGC